MLAKLKSSVYCMFTVLLFSAILSTSGCNITETEGEPIVKPLESPYGEVIPTCEDLHCQLFYLKPEPYEHTIYRPDGAIVHSRMYESNDQQVLLSMSICEYPDEELAVQCIHDERIGPFCDKADIENYARRFQFPLEDIAGHVIFWKEPSDDGAKGREKILFRMGHHVGDYEVWLDSPPQLEDGYYIPLPFHDLLETAVDVTIPRLSSIQTP